MAKLMAYCGMDCGECPAYVATQSKNDAMKKQVADFMNQKLGAKYVAQDINCDGCPTNKNLVPHCNVCEVRLCGVKTKVANCGVCGDYECGKLSKLYTMIPPTARQNLEALRKTK
jgi:hypothetical protein